MALRGIFLLDIFYLIFICWVAQVHTNMNRFEPFLIIFKNWGIYSTFTIVSVISANISERNVTDICNDTWHCSFSRNEQGGSESSIYNSRKDLYDTGKDQSTIYY